MSSEEFTDDRMNCVRPEGQTLIHPVVQGHYTRYSIIKDQGLQVRSAVTLAERKNQRCVSSPDLSTVILELAMRQGHSLEILGQDVAHDLRSANTHAGISIR